MSSSNEDLIGKIRAPHIPHTNKEKDKFHSVHEFAGREVEMFQKGTSLFSNLGFERPKMGLGQYMRALVNPLNEYERFAVNSSSDNAGGYELPADLSALFIDYMADQSVVTSAGAYLTTIGDRNVASVVGNVTATFRGENEAVTENEPFTSVKLLPKTVSAIVKASREQVQDSINFERDVARTAVSALTTAMDMEVLQGTGGDGLNGILGTAGVLAVNPTNANGDELEDWKKLSKARYLLDESAIDSISSIMSPREAFTLDSLVDTLGQPLNPPYLTRYPKNISRAVKTDYVQGTSSDASNIFVGDFTRLLLGFRLGIRIELLKENFAAKYQYGYLISARLDSVVTKPSSFCVIKGIVV